MSVEYGSFFGQTATDNGQQTVNQPNPLEGGGQGHQSQAGESGQGGQDDLRTTVSQLQQQLEQERQWKQNFQRFVAGDQGNQIDPNVANAQLRQMLQENPAQVLSTYGQNLTQQLPEVAREVAAQTYATQMAVNHFNTNYAHYADYGPEVELQVANIVNELQAQGKVGAMTPTGIIDEAVKRFEQRFNFSGQRQQSGNPRVVASLDVNSVNNPHIPASRPTGQNADWWSMSSDEFAAKRRQVINQSYGY